MKVLELYSGIGGMHYALKESGVYNASVVASIDINTTANQVYKRNFPTTLLLNRNIESLTAAYINNLGVDSILMSPPCQPFTRNGLKGDTSDRRTCSFTHILKILPELNIKHILIENVKGFETSQMRNNLIDVLSAANFAFQEFILSPTQFGVPNTRHRYYCLAKKFPGCFKFQCSKLVSYKKLLSALHRALRATNFLQMESVPEQYISASSEPNSIACFLDEHLDLDNYRLSDSILQKRAMILDICFSDSKRSCCFTKAYGRYVEGTGSVYSDKTKVLASAVYENLESIARDSDGYVECIKCLDLRFFTPSEVCRLMSFPSCFSFPDCVSKKQRYMLLGNSLNVKVVSELIKILVN